MSSAPSSPKPSSSEVAAAATVASPADHPQRSVETEVEASDVEIAIGTQGEPAAEQSEHPSSPSQSVSSRESGEASPDIPDATGSAAPPLPNEAPPTDEQQDDGWDFHWDATHQAYFFHNRITGESTWENPRLFNAAATATSSSSAAPGTTLSTAPPLPGGAEPPRNERPPAGGYNPAIHGDYDPNAWYAQADQQEPTTAGDATAAVPGTAAYAALGSFNRFTGRWQGGEGAQNPEQHSDESKSRRQMNAFFDVDAAANSHNGRSLKAERSGKKPNKAELKQFKEKRRAKKEEKRRAWLLD